MLTIFTAMFVLILLTWLVARDPAACPPPPPRPNYGTPAQRAGQSSVDIDLSGGYMRERISKLIEPGPHATRGVSSHYFQLQEQVVNGERLNLMKIGLQPWGRGRDGEKVNLPQEYSLSLKLVP